MIVVQRFDPASAQANLNLMSRILKPPKGKVDHIFFLIGKWEEVVRRQDERTGRQALADDMGRAIMMDTCPAELENHLILNSDRFDKDPKTKFATSDYAEQMRHKSSPIELDEMARFAEEDGEGVGRSARSRTRQGQGQIRCRASSHGAIKIRRRCLLRAERAQLRGGLPRRHRGFRAPLDWRQSAPSAKQLAHRLHERNIHLLRAKRSQSHHAQEPTAYHSAPSTPTGYCGTGRGRHITHGYICW